MPRWGAFYQNRLTEVGLRKISFDKKGVTEMRNMHTVTPDGIRSRLRPGIGYARTLGNFREEEVPGAKRITASPVWVTNMSY